MSNSVPPGDGDREYRVGNKKPPLHSRFKPGRSGNPRGRPKGRRDFGQLLMTELHRVVSATINGQPVRLSNMQLLAAQLVKAGISKGTPAMALLLKTIEAQEAKQAIQAEQNKKSPSTTDFDWSEEQERLYKELENITYEIKSRSNET